MRGARRGACKLTSCKLRQRNDGFVGETRSCCAPKYNRTSLFVVAIVFHSHLKPQNNETLFCLMRFFSTSDVNIFLRKSYGAWGESRARAAKARLRETFSFLRKSSQARKPTIVVRRKNERKRKMLFSFKLWSVHSVACKKPQR